MAINIQNQANFDDYRGSFVQSVPRYAVKRPGDTWHTRQFPLHDSEVKKHLDGELAIACLGRWYPEYAALDFDDIPREKVEELRGDLELDEGNSMLISSESKDSYHLYIRPEYNDKPPTLNLLQAILGPYAKSHGVEIYPQKNRAFRLPFGKGQDCLDFEDRCIQGWEKQLYWLAKKDDFDLSSVKGHQMPLAFKAIDLPEADLERSIDIPELLKNGLQGPSTRDWAQFELTKNLWHQNVLKSDAIAFIWSWLNRHHNGYSKDLLRNPKEVQKHISHQVNSYYNHLQTGAIYPDRPHQNHNGYICKPDLLEIVKLARGNLPRIRFLFELVKFMNPRRYRESVSIHSDRFMDWTARGGKYRSGKYYMKYLNFLSEKGVIKRESGYKVGVQSKVIKLTWPYKSDKEAVLFNGRAVETLERAISLLFKPEDLRSILRGYVAKSTATMTTQTLFKGVKKGNENIHDSWGNPFLNLKSYL